MTPQYPVAFQSILSCFLSFTDAFVSIQNAMFSVSWGLGECHVFPGFPSWPHMLGAVGTVRLWQMQCVRPYSNPSNSQCLLSTYLIQELSVSPEVIVKTSWLDLVDRKPLWAVYPSNHRINRREARVGPWKDGLDSSNICLYQSFETDKPIFKRTSI